MKDCCKKSIALAFEATKVEEIEIKEKSVHAYKLPESQFNVLMKDDFYKEGYNSALLDKHMKEVDYLNSLSE